MHATTNRMTATMCGNGKKKEQTLHQTDSALFALASPVTVSETLHLLEESAISFYSLDGAPVKACSF